LCATLRTKTFLCPFPDADFTLSPERPIASSFVNPYDEALWNPVKLNGSLENASLLVLAPFGYTLNALLFLVKAHKTQLGTFVISPLYYN